MKIETKAIYDLHDFAALAIENYYLKTKIPAEELDWEVVSQSSVAVEIAIFIKAEREKAVS